MANDTPGLVADAQIATHEPPIVKTEESKGPEATTKNLTSTTLPKPPKKRRIVKPPAAPLDHQIYLKTYTGDRW